ncbi:MAG: polyphenol oxidase family protein [Gemmatimonadota bacterium]
MDRELAPGFAELGVIAFTTTRSAGDFSTRSTKVGEGWPRWVQLMDFLRPATRRIACATQVHGAAITEHGPGWSGWLRCHDSDGHVAGNPSTAMAVTLADCVPVFIAHPSGVASILHSGWRGTVAGITPAAIAHLDKLGCAPADLTLHCGPAICGACYEVSAEVARALTGERYDAPVSVDLRAIIAGQARALGVRKVSVSAECTLCGGGRYFSHRGGDGGRQIGVIASRTRVGSG